MNPSIRAGLLLAAFLVSAGARAEEAVFNLKTASPEVRASVDKFRTELQIVGFRFDDETGALIEPKTKKPATTKLVEEYLKRIRLDRAHMAVARIEELLKGLDPSKPVPPETAARIEEIVKDTPGLPEDLVKVLAGARVGDAGSLHEKALASFIGLTRQVDGENGFVSSLTEALPSAGGWGHKPPLPGYADAAERALGERISRATIDYFARYQTGRELLDRFKDEKGRVRLPDMMVLQVEDFAGAFYSAANRAMVCNFGPVKEAIIERAPPEKQAGLQAKLKTAKDLNEYLAKDPEAIQGFLEAFDVPLYHELTHAWQDKRQRLATEQLRNNAPGNDPLEGEWEAFTNQNRFLHEKLLKDPDAATRSNYFPMYEQMLANYDQFTDGITRNYLQLMPAGAATLPDMKSLQRRRQAATKETMKDDLVSALRGLFKLIGMSQGTTALEQAQDDYAARRDAFRHQELPRMQVEGNLALADVYEKGGDWQKALGAAYLAEAASPGAPALADTARTRADRLAQAAYDAVLAGKGKVEDRASAITYLVARRESRKRGPEISAGLRVASYLDVAQDYLKRSESATDPKIKEQLKAGAKSWVDAISDKPESLEDPALAERLKALRFETEARKP